MKRTNLLVDEVLLKEAKQLLGADSYSATVNQALDQAVKWVKVQRLTDLFGSGAWSGDLAEMREDKGKKKRPRRSS